MKKLLLKIAASALAGVMLVSALPVFALEDDVVYSDYDAFAEIEVTDKEIDEFYYNERIPAYKALDYRKDMYIRIRLYPNADYSVCGISFADCVVYPDDSEDVKKEKENKRDNRVFQLADKLGLLCAARNDPPLDPKDRVVFYKGFFLNNKLNTIPDANGYYGCLEFALVPQPIICDELEGNEKKHDVEATQRKIIKHFIVAEKALREYFPNKTDDTSTRMFTSDSNDASHVFLDRPVGSSTSTFGKLNDDENVNVADLSILCKFVAKIQEPAGFQLIDADVYRDYDINSKDLIKLAKYVAEFDGIVLGDAN